MTVGQLRFKLTVDPKSTQVLDLPIRTQDQLHTYTNVSLTGSRSQWYQTRPCYLERLLSYLRNSGYMVDEPVVPV